MPSVHRVLFPEPIASLEEYLARGGGVGLEAALRQDARRAHRRGRRRRGCGAGAAPGSRPGASGGPSATTTRRTWPRRSWSTAPKASRARSRTAPSCGINPYPVIEGALIAAKAVGADEIVFGLKRSFGPES